MKDGLSNPRNTKAPPIVGWLIEFGSLIHRLLLHPFVEDYSGYYALLPTTPGAAGISLWFAGSYTSGASSNTLVTDRSAYDHRMHSCLTHLPNQGVPIRLRSIAIHLVDCQAGTLNFSFRNVGVVVELVESRLYKKLLRAVSQ